MQTISASRLGKSEAVVVFVLFCLLTLKSDCSVNRTLIFARMISISAASVRIGNLLGSNNPNQAKKTAIVALGIISCTGIIHVTRFCVCAYPYFYS